MVLAFKALKIAPKFLKWVRVRVMVGVKGRVTTP